MGSKPAFEICSGTYFPRRGKPQHGYYVVLDDMILSGPFARRREAAASLTELARKNVGGIMPQLTPCRHLPSQYVRTIESVLRKQKKALTAAMGASSPHFPFVWR